VEVLKMSLFRSNPEKHRQKLNGRTPGWFKDWCACEFVPVQTKLNLVMGMAVAILIGVIISIVGRV